MQVVREGVGKLEVLVGGELNSEFSLDRRYLLQKLRLQSSLDRRSGFTLLQCRNRINRRASLSHHEMEVRSGGKSGLADQADQFSQGGGWVVVEKTDRGFKAVHHDGDHTEFRLLEKEEERLSSA